MFEGHAVAEFFVAGMQVPVPQFLGDYNLLKTQLSASTRKDSSGKEWRRLSYVVLLILYDGKRINLQYLSRAKDSVHLIRTNKVFFRSRTINHL